MSYQTIPDMQGTLAATDTEEKTKMEIATIKANYYS